MVTIQARPQSIHASLHVINLDHMRGSIVSQDLIANDRLVFINQGNLAEVWPNTTKTIWKMRKLITILQLYVAIISFLDLTAL